MGDANVDTPGMMVWIRAAARAIRLEHGRSPARIAVERDVRESTVTRFEAGRTVQVDVDRMIAAYSDATGVAPIEFWQRAIDMWRGG